MQRIELYNDNYANWKSYNIPAKAQLVIADIPYQIGKNAYGSNPEWYNGGDNKNGESKLAGKSFFNGHRAYATDTYRLVIAKDYPTNEAHYEDVDGNIVTEGMPENPVDYEKVLIRERDISWSYDIKHDYIMDEVITPLKTACDFIVKAAKRRGDIPIMMLQKQGEQLTAYAVSEKGPLRIKMTLLNFGGHSSGDDWEMGFHPGNLLLMANLLKDTYPGRLYMSVNAAHNILCIETDDLIMLGTKVRVLKNASDEYSSKLVDFVSEESDFLD